MLSRLLKQAGAIGAALLVGLFVFAQGSTEGLTEMAARAGRISTATYDHSYIENESSLVWQPETFTYNATGGGIEPYGVGKGGAEVWKMTSGPHNNNYNGLGAPYFSRNGKWLVFYSNRQSSGYADPAAGISIFYITSSTGKYLQPFASTASTRLGQGSAGAGTSRSPAINWNPAVDDEFWVEGASAYGVTGAYTYYIYRNRVSSTGVITRGSTSGVDMLDTSASGGSTSRKVVDKAISGDGLRMELKTSACEMTDMTATDANPSVIDSGQCAFTSTSVGMWVRIISGTNLVPGDYTIASVSAGSPYTATLDRQATSGGAGSAGVAYVPTHLFPVTIVPDTSITLNNTKGWIMDRGMGLTATQYSSQPVDFAHEHGDGYWFGGNAFHGYGAIGLIPTGGATFWRYSATGAAADGGPVYTDGGLAGDVRIISAGRPNMPAWNDGCVVGHSSPDWWNRLFIGVGSDALEDPKALVFDVANQQMLGRSDFVYVASGNHYADYHAFSDYFAYTSGLFTDTSNNYIVIAKYDTNDSQKAICRANNTYNALDYNTTCRLAQSTDGTKIHYPASFLNGSSLQTDVYYAVAYYPYPAEITGATKVSTNVRLAFTPTPYTNRGWPDDSALTTDDPPEPKEIEHWRVWVSADKSTWTEATDAAPVDFTTRTYDYAQSSGTTLYYAMTSTEYSGLESRRLGNIWKVTLDGDGDITTQEEDTDYPESPGDISEFYTTKPSAISGFSATKQETASHDLLAWTEPANNKVRYYNVYYSTTDSTPAVSQATRIASLPVGTAGWLDWNIDTTSSDHYYAITAVDRQGNESDPAYSDGSGGDAEDPDISITNPDTSSWYTRSSASPVTISGTASDNTSVTSVTWVNSKGGSGTATGTTSWSFTATLAMGSNVFTVTAHDDAENTGEAEVTLILRETGNSLRRRN